jgi:hypothetical protein
MRITLVAGANVAARRIRTRRVLAADIRDQSALVDIVAHHAIARITLIAGTDEAVRRVRTRRVLAAVVRAQGAFIDTAYSAFSRSSAGREISVVCRENNLIYFKTVLPHIEINRVHSRSVDSYARGPEAERASAPAQES